MKSLLLILALLLSGCGSTAPAKEGTLVGTLSVYKTSKGFVVVSDQSGEKLVVAFHVARVYSGLDD